MFCRETGPVPVGGCHEEILDIQEFKKLIMQVVPHLSSPAFPRLSSDRFKKRSQGELKSVFR